MGSFAAAVCFLFSPVCDTMEPYQLLVIARTQSFAKRLRGSLDAEQVLIRWVPSAAQALELDWCPSLLILDLPPSGGARSVARLKRLFNAPVLVVSRSDRPVPDQVDVSLSRPYRLEQLVELIEITLIDHSPHRIRVAGMSLDTETRRLQVNGSVCQLRPIGCQILALLMARAGSVVSRDELFHRVWHTEDGDNTRALDVHIAQLRQQMETDARHPPLILTERGRGYRLQPPTAAP
jgi:DNA-binding response OmpR family regulator